MYLVGMTDSNGHSRVWLKRWPTQVVVRDANAPGGVVCGTLEGCLTSYAVSNDENRACVGFEDGRLIFMEIVR